MSNTATKQEKRPPMPQKLEPYETVQKWTPDFKFTRGSMTFRGDQWEAWVEKMLPGYHDLPDISKDQPVEVGAFKTGVRLMPLYEWREPHLFLWSPGRPRWERTRLKIWKGTTVSYASFDRPVKVPILYSMGETMMSPTPMEIMTMRSGIRKAKGCVCVGGFGMGFFVRQLLEKRTVKSITVVDNEPATWDRYGKIPGVTFVKADAFEFAKKHADFDRYLFDVWPSFGHASDDERLHELHELYPGKVWGWGDVRITPNTSLWG